MTTPTPTTLPAAGPARGRLAGTIPATHATPAMIRFAVPGTRYELHLEPTAALPDGADRRLTGTIRARATRVDVVGAGGRFIEPVAGKPRRVQGIVIGHTPDALIVNAVVPIHAQLTDPRQKPTDFEIGTMVAFDVPDVPTFTPA